MPRIISTTFLYLRFRYRHLQSPHCFVTVFFFFSVEQVNKMLINILNAYSRTKRTAYTKNHIISNIIIIIIHNNKRRAWKNMENKISILFSLGSLFSDSFFCDECNTRDEFTSVLLWKLQDDHHEQFFSDNLIIL